MGADNVSSYKDEVKAEFCESNYKIQKLENGMLVGAVGNAKICEIIKGYPEIFTLDKSGKLTRREIVESIVPSLIALLGRNKLLKENERYYPQMSACLFVAHKGELFEICSSFDVYKYEDFQAVGVMADFAQYVLSKIEQDDDINAKIVEALDCVSRFSAYANPPYVLIDTDKLEYSIVGGE
jgi:ATP-dependent protease HslVU (ClpYQ) peptidase subunit